LEGVELLQIHHSNEWQHQVECQEERHKLLKQNQMLCSENSQLLQIQAQMQQKNCQLVEDYQKLLLHTMHLKAKNQEYVSELNKKDDEIKRLQRFA
jgi:predicted nuclease with TOPRIM domain